MAAAEREPTRPPDHLQRCFCQPQPCCPPGSHFTLLYPNRAAVGAHSGPCHGWAALLCPAAQAPHRPAALQVVLLHQVSPKHKPAPGHPCSSLYIAFIILGQSLELVHPPDRSHLHTVTSTPCCHPGEPDTPSPTPSLRLKPRAATWSPCSRNIPSASWYVTSLLHGDKVSHSCSLQSPRSPAPFKSALSPPTMPMSPTSASGFCVLHQGCPQGHQSTTPLQRCPQGRWQQDLPAQLLCHPHLLPWGAGNRHL